MEQNPLIQFILNIFQVDDIIKVNPFAGFTIPTYEPAREITTNVELAGNGTLLINGEFKPRKPFNNLPYNMDDVSVRTLYIRYISNPNPQTAYICKIFDPISGLKEAADVNKMLAAMGGPPGLAVEIPANREGRFNTFLIKENPQCIYLNDAFIKTFMHIDLTNIMNGIINVPPSVCAAAGLPKVGIVESGSIDIDYYVLVPKNHVLAWCLNIGEHWRIKKGWYALELTVKTGNNVADILYFIVANKTFDLLKQGCLENFMNNKIDRRPLKSIGIKTTQNIKVDISVSFVCYPFVTPEMKSKMIPILSEDFPKYSEVIRRELLKQGPKQK